MTRYIFLIITACFISCTGNTRPGTNPEQPGAKPYYDRLKASADSLKKFCTKEGCNVNYGILADMSVHSGKKRLFVWDFAADTVLWSGLCCHGYGKGSTGEKIVFSNESGSYCSSLGKYRIGKRAYSKWGIHVHYKLHGLEPTNSNAYDRVVVLHSHSGVPDTEIYPNHLLLGYSQGCPVISDQLMMKIDTLLKKTGAGEPVILWIYR